YMLMGGEDVGDPIPNGLPGRHADTGLVPHQQPAAASVGADDVEPVVGEPEIGRAAGERDLLPVRRPYGTSEQPVRGHGRKALLVAAVGGHDVDTGPATLDEEADLRPVRRPDGVRS